MAVIRDERPTPNLNDIPYIPKADSRSLNVAKRINEVRGKTPSYVNDDSLEVHDYECLKCTTKINDVQGLTEALEGKASTSTVSSLTAVVNGKADASAVNRPYVLIETINLSEDQESITRSYGPDAEHTPYNFDNVFIVLEAAAGTRQVEVICSIRLGSFVTPLKIDDAIDTSSSKRSIWFLQKHGNLWEYKMQGPGYTANMMSTPLSSYKVSYGVGVLVPISILSLSIQTLQKRILSIFLLGLRLKSMVRELLFNRCVFYHD